MTGGGRGDQLPGDASGVYEQIARLARDAHGSRALVPEPDQVLTSVTQWAVAMLDGVDHAGVTLLRRTRRGPRAADSISSTAETSAVARRFDALQEEHAQGPCLEAVWEQTTVRTRDMASESRWPQLAAAVVAELPIRSTLSIELYVTDSELGALNLHSEQIDAFDFDAEQVAVNLATHAAIALSGAQRGQQFRSALASRDLIGQAKGMLMERFDINAVAAFGLLQQLSQESNTRLQVIAAQLIVADHPPDEVDGGPQAGERP